MASEAASSPALGLGPAIRPKRPHKKSRLGCTNCKLRKVKCDEVRPACHSCRLRRTNCEYDSAPLRKNGPSESLLVPYQGALPVATLPRAVSPTDDPALCGLSADRMDMKLLWFYTSSTYKSLSRDDEKQVAMNKMLQTVMVQHAFEAPFLMDAIMELAVLHMQSLGQATESSRALIYQTRSIEGYRKAILEANPNSFGALLANSVIRPMLSGEVFRDPNAKNLYLLDWMQLWHGVGSIISITSSNSIVATGMLPLFKLPSFDLDASEAAIPKELLLMVSFIERNEDDASELEVYQKSLRTLGALAYELRAGLDSVMVMRIAIWSTIAPTRLRELAQAGRPRALVILAHWATFLKLAKDIWWLAGVGDRSIKDICHVLDLGWHKYLKLPLQALLIENSIDLIPAILSGGGD